LSHKQDKTDTGAWMGLGFRLNENQNALSSANETGQFKKHTQSRRSLDSSAFFCGFFTDLIIWKGRNELCRWAVRLATDWGRKRKKIQEY